MAKLLAEHRREIGTRRGTRALTCYKQAVFALGLVPRPAGCRTARPGLRDLPGHRLRYLAEAITVLAARAPELREALECAVAHGLPYLILDGKVVASNRLKEKIISKKGRGDRPLVFRETHGFGGTSRH